MVNPPPVDLEHAVNINPRSSTKGDNSGEVQSTTTERDAKVQYTTTAQHLEQTDSLGLGNLVYTDEDEEPKFHMRTWIAYGAMILLIFVQSLSLQGPPTILAFIVADLNGTTAQTWVPNSLSVVQAALGPVICLASDAFQARKQILVVAVAFSIIGSAIAPGSQSIYRLIAAQTLIGFGFSAVPITYSVPSEILPRKWRPMAQAVLNIFAAFSAMAGPLIAGALTKRDAHTGWRDFYWIQCALWGAAAGGIVFGYRPPKRRSALANLSLSQKLNHLDLPGCGLLATGLVLLLVGLDLGGNPYPWTNGRVLSTIVIGIVFLMAFCFWEWKGTKNGMLAHELFLGEDSRGRMLAVSVALIFIEAILFFAFIIFYPVMTNALFETDPLLSVIRLEPFWVAFIIGAPIFGWVSTKFRVIREPLFVSYVFFTIGMIGLATVQPGQKFTQLAFAALSGLGFGGPIILIIAAVQLATPHHLIATSTAVTTSSRAVGATIFTAIYGAALSQGLKSKIPRYVAAAVTKAGLPAISIAPFIEALAGNKRATLATIPGVTPLITADGVLALQHAYADSLRVIYIIAAPFGVLACGLCFLLGDAKSLMTYKVEAPMEELHAKSGQKRG